MLIILAYVTPYAKQITSSFLLLTHMILLGYLSYLLLFSLSHKIVQINNESQNLKNYF